MYLVILNSHLQSFKTQTSKKEKNRYQCLILDHSKGGGSGAAEPGSLMLSEIASSPLLCAGLLYSQVSFTYPARSRATCSSDMSKQDSKESLFPFY